MASKKSIDTEMTLEQMLSEIIHYINQNVGTAHGNDIDRQVDDADLSDYKSIEKVYKNLRL